MREIKFRAWDKVMQNWVIFIEEQIEIRRSNKSGYFTLKQFDPPRFILMQFTGLKDKNGKEIYEGDIVKLVIQHQSIENGNSLETEISQVEFTPTYFRLRGSILGAGSLISENCEIVGNIYENPELLGTK